jgi:hypothetical protein
VENARETLAAPPPSLADDGSDSRWPDVTNAVHWLVDDTWWDAQDPGTSIGTILRNEREAAAIRPVVAALVGVSERQGATATDAQWFGDIGWSELRRLAGEALEVLRA